MDGVKDSMSDIQKQRKAVAQAFVKCNRLLLEAVDKGIEVRLQQGE